MRFDPDRRRLLRMLAGLATAALVGPRVLAALVEQLTSPQPIADALRSLVPHHESAARLGHAYLAVHPSEGNVRQLALSILGPEWSTERDIGTTVRSEMERDFAAHRTVRVDGWILSRTEARLYALVARVSQHG